MERVKTGIPGFDELVEGGLPKGFNVLLAGAPGTGKTIFGLQYLYNGAKSGENGIYVSLDSSEKRLKEQALQFGWDFDGLKKDGGDKEGDVLFLEVPVDRVKVNLFDMIEDAIAQTGAKRLVFDNLVNFVINAGQFVVPLNFMSESEESRKDRFSRYSEDEASKVSLLKGRTMYNTAPPEVLSIKRSAYLVVHELETLGTTNLIVTFAKQEGENQFATADGVSEFACDSIIALYYTLIGAKRVRTLSVLKMRDTSHSPYIHDFEFTGEGVVVKPAEEVYK